MAGSEHAVRISAVGFALALVLTFLLMGGTMGMQAQARTLGYEDRLFDTGRVHSIDIVLEDWEGFLDGCENEEYTICGVVIDGEAYQNIGLRAKGNTSLSTVSQMGSDRYSFKIEFDHYDSGKTYHGLDKLCLNNIIQDHTYMKDYLAYQMMGAFGVDAPLCSYVYITVNGDDWGLYLAVEGVEDGFLRRNYGSDPGELYKPDSMSLGGGRGNGKDFDMDGLAGWPGDGGPDRQPVPEGSGQESHGRQDGGFLPPAAGGGMGASDVKLQYIDDDPDSYANIFDNAKTEPSETDRERLVAALKSLSAYENLDRVLDMEEVLRYFVVHNFVVNGDSYTGAMVHNYYLYEKDGQLSMIPWDYNLAFGTFQAGDAGSAVNDTIDGALTDRPMQAWIFSDERYTAMYHALFEEFLDTADTDEIISGAYALIAPYVEKDPTKFCTYGEFESGVEALREFCALRAESIREQLDGGVAQVDASGLDLSDMGTMGRAGGPDAAEAGAFGWGGISGFEAQWPEPPGGNAGPPAGGGVPPSEGQGGFGWTAILLAASVLALAGGIVFTKRVRH